MNERLSLSNVSDRAALASVLTAAGAPLDQPEQNAALDAVQLELAWAAWDIKFAAVLNQHVTSMRHGARQDFTNMDARRIQLAVIESEATVLGADVNSVVSSGFGEPVRVQLERAMSATLAKALEALAAIPRSAATTGEAEAAGQQHAPLVGKVAEGSGSE